MSERKNTKGKTMKIPRDLKPGDRVRHFDPETGHDKLGAGTVVMAKHMTAVVKTDCDGKEREFYLGFGTIERIASAKPVKAKMDKDAAWLLKNGMARSYIHVSNSYFDGRIRAIAKRLNGGAL